MGKINVKKSILEIVKKNNLEILKIDLCNDYEFAAGYCLEHYDDPTKYEMGTKDPKYNAEIWIPVRKKD